MGSQQLEMPEATRYAHVLSKRGPLQIQEQKRLKLEGWRKVFHVNENQKTAGVAILTSDKRDFKMKTAITDKEGHYITIKGLIQEEDITIVNIYAPSIGEPQYISQVLMAIREEIDSNTIIVGTLTLHLHQWTGQPDRKSIREQT